jgi:MoaA/NifB/PqqE/SkfB family radical SAM enzyme
MDAAAAAHPIIQIHPTRRCNLRCLHCYSFSGPEERDILHADTLADALTDASAHGYVVASFSGGEPVLYHDLDRLLGHAKTLGMRTTVTSNGTLLTRKRMDRLRDCTDVLAISLDGVPESHNRMRASGHAFDRMRDNLDHVRASGVDFGFIFTLTLHNVNEMEWAAQFAVDQGAKLFQIHPLEEVGRAAVELAGRRPDEIESAYAYLAAEYLRQKHAGRLFVQLDLFHRDLLRQHGDHVCAGDMRCEATQLSQCVTPLVIEADGTVVPLGYGFGRPYALGTLARERLRDMAPRWITEGSPAFRSLCRSVFAEACTPSELPFLNWYELVSLRSASLGAAAR